MAELSDLLVSYKLVKAPTRSNSRISDLPTDRYSRLLNYIDNRNTELTTTTDLQSNDLTWRSWRMDLTSSSPALPVGSHLYSDRNKWRSDMTAAYKKYGLNDNAIKNLIAKNALESGWGRSTAGQYNYGNITAGKYWKGDTVSGGDHDKDGNEITQRFRSYASMDDYVKDEIDFLTRLYDFDLNDDFDTFISKLLGRNKGRRRYAESTNYAANVRSVYRGL